MTVTAEQTALGIRMTEPLRLIAGGQSIKPIARSLGIALKTADNHVQNLYAKMGVKTRGGATLLRSNTGSARWRKNRESSAGGKSAAGYRV